MVGAGFCPLGELVQGDGYGRRPPGRSPGRAPLRGASPLRSSGGACGRPPAPCTGCKKGKRPLRRRHAARPSPARPPGFMLRGGGGLLPFRRVGAGGWIRPQAARASPGQGAPPGRLPAAEQRGACGRPPAPCTGCKKGKRPRAPPRKSTCPIYNRIAPLPGAFLHHGGMGGIGWCSGRPSRRPIDT